MRWEDQRSEGLFSYVGLEARITADHPSLTDQALAGLSQEFNKILLARRLAVDPARATAASAAIAAWWTGFSLSPRLPIICFVLPSFSRQRDESV
jgi:hypothetical protein